MFRDIWNHRLANADATAKAAKQEISKIERQIEQLLDRVMETASTTVISAYEQRITKLENDKLVMREKMENGAGPRHTFEEMFEHAMAFLSNPWKLWS